MLRACVVVAIFSVSLVGSPAAAQTEAPAGATPSRLGGLELVAHLPKDPLFANVIRVEDPAAIWDSIQQIAKKFLPGETDEFDAALASFDEKLGVSFRDDILAQLGPEIAGSFDLPAIDMVAGLIMAESPESIKTTLSELGIVCQVRSREQFNRILWQLFEKAGATIGQEGTLVRASFGLEPEQPEIVLNVYYGFKDKILALGFSPEWVNNALAPRTADQRLTAGADFADLLGHLDSPADGLVYVNLPKIQELIRNSAMLRGMIATNPDAAPIATALLDPEFVPLGFATTYQRIDQGTRRVSYGPSWMMAGTTQVGIVTAIAIPNLLNAIQRGRQKRTIADMTTMATALEAYRIDNDVFPGSQGEWVDAEMLAEQLVPVYLRTMLRTDGWDVGLRYRSDGTNYWIVSPGRDGEPDQEWAGVEDVTTITDFDNDIVYSNGAFLRRPELAK